MSDAIFLTLLQCFYNFLLLSNIASKRVHPRSRNFKNRRPVTAGDDDKVHNKKHQRYAEDN